MLEAIVFTVVFALLFVARIVIATIVFFWILPEADRCPVCDAPTLRVQHRAMNALVPRLRTSWCPECRWEGLLRPGPITPAPTPRPRKQIVSRG
jgi:hypothetical protein